MSPTEERDEVSNEFFKKLNQQIVQKDNLIKLLQLQIKNLKGHLDELEGDGPQKSDLARQLDAKEADITRLQRELAEQQKLREGLEKSKDEQIEELNRQLAEIQQLGSDTETLEDPRIPQLEAELQSLTDQLQQRNELAERLETQNSGMQGALKKLEEERDELQKKLETSSSDAEIAALHEQIASLQEETTATNQTIAGLRSEIEEKNSRLSELSERLNDIGRLEGEKETLQQQVSELEENVIGLSDQLATAKAAISTEDSAAAAATAELQEILRQRDEELQELAPLREQVQKLENAVAEKEQSELRAAAAQAELDTLTQQNGSLSEALKAAEDELKHAQDLEKNLDQRNKEIAQLQGALAAKQERLREEAETSEEIEQLTNQVADQLLAIQKFEEHLRATEQELAEKTEALEILQKQLQKSDEPLPISLTDPTVLVSSFIDFFDGLDAMLAGNPLPEIRALHQKLLEQLIVPNQILYQPVISETFDSERHVATDYFRSHQFPEKCIVFEVEKGYAIGGKVIKKSKVWVVQNLFACPQCETMQSNPESRFCHMCGAKMMAPNGVPVDSLPVFQPTATTYLKFAERAVAREDYEKGKTLLRQGLQIEPESISSLVLLAEAHAHDSEFEEAIEALKKVLEQKEDQQLQDKLHQYMVKNTIFQQARTLRLNPDEFQKLITLIQK